VAWLLLTAASHVYREYLEQKAEQKGYLEVMDKEDVALKRLAPLQRSQALGTGTIGKMP
jgi:hypothetical protein